MGVSARLHAPVALPSGKNRGTHCTGRWVSLRAGLDVVDKRRILPPSGIEPRIVYPGNGGSHFRHVSSGVSVVDQTVISWQGV
jgi:hypothetical protein